MTKVTASKERELFIAYVPAGAFAFAKLILFWYRYMLFLLLFDIHHSFYAPVIECSSRQIYHLFIFDQIWLYPDRFCFENSVGLDKPAAEDPHYFLFYLQ